jgi:hypothetical protein
VICSVQISASIDFQYLKIAMCPDEGSKSSEMFLPEQDQTGERKLN